MANTPLPPLHTPMFGPAYPQLKPASSAPWSQWFDAIYRLVKNNITTFPDGDTTPSVRDGATFKTANTGATTITMFDQGDAGQEITIIFTDANTTLTDGGNLNLAGGFVSTANDTMRLIFDGTDWFELSRSVN